MEVLQKASTLIESSKYKDCLVLLDEHDAPIGASTLDTLRLICEDLHQVTEGTVLAGGFPLNALRFTLHNLTGSEIALWEAASPAM